MYGILTYHDGYNFGTFLQVYSLQQKVRELGHDCCVINYKNPVFSRKEYFALLNTKRPNVFVGALKKAWKFHQGHKLLELTHRFSQPECIGDLGLKGVIYGSDEIWNYKNPAIGGFDSAYFGGHYRDGVKISYAPSFGTLSLEEKVPPEVKTLLSGFNHLSVRDIHSQKLVESILGETPELVIDPTLLYELRGQENDCPLENFILVYTTGFPNHVQDELVQLARHTGRKLVSVGYRHGFCDINLIGLGPFDYLGYVKNADCVVTSMFHGVMLSLVYHKRMAVVVDPYRTNKLSTVMDSFKVRERVYSPGRLTEILNTEVDHLAIEQSLASGRESSGTFLRRALTNQSAE